MKLANQALHGAEVTPEAAIWAAEWGPIILSLVKE